jgi:putative aldouronate transport system permease protein
VKIDGATKLQSIIHITIPLLKDTAILLFLLSVGSIFFGDFGMIYAIVGDNPLLFSTTDVIDTFVFRALRGTGSTMGMAAAIGLYQSVVGFLVVIISNSITRKYNKDAAIF